MTVPASISSGMANSLSGRAAMGVTGNTNAPGRLPDEAVAGLLLWCRPICYPAYAFAKRALQATTMAAIDAAARLDDWLSRGMSDPASLRAHALRYRELKGREITWTLPG
jgi:enoyl-CoA hydratase